MGSSKRIGRVVAALMIHPCTIATSPPNNVPLCFTRSLTVRPPPSSHDPRSISAAAASTTMNAQETSSGNVSNLEAIFKQKRIIRSRVRKDLKAMDPTLRSLEDDKIQSIILEAPWFKACKRLCAYISCSALREVDTSKLLSEILQNPSVEGHAQVGKKLYVPRLEDKNSHMRMLNITSVEDLIANSMNILEPASIDVDGNEREDVMKATEPVDLFLLPGLAFDKCGRRLGRGGGYYDTFLSNYQQLAKERNWKQPLLIGLSYSLQIMEDGVIPVTPSDVPIDALVSPSGVIPFSAAVSENFH